VAGTGGEDQLVAADIATGIGALARDFDLAVAVQRVDEDGLAVRRAARAALAAVGRGAVHGDRLVFRRSGPVGTAVAGVDIDGAWRGGVASGGIRALLASALRVRRIVPIGRALQVRGGGRVELGGLYGHGGSLSSGYGGVLFKPPRSAHQAGA